MKIRGLLIAVGVLAILTGVLYWSNHRKPAADATASASPDATLKVVTLDPDNVVRLSFHHKDEPQVDLARDNSGAWQITAPKQLQADQNAVTAVLVALSALSADHVIDNHASDLAQYGLANPALEIDIATKDNKMQKVVVGDPTPAGGGYFFMLGGDPRLLSLGGENKTLIDKTSSDLRDKRLLSVNFDKATQIEFIHAKAGATQDITFAHDKDAWQMVKPTAARTDGDQVGQLIQSLQEARLSADSADDPKIAAAFNSSAPFVTAKVTGSGGTQELDIRKAKDQNAYYAKSSAMPDVYGVDTGDVARLDKSLDDFRKKALFDFGFDELNKIEIHDGAKSYALSNASDAWWGPDGKKLDPDSVEPLISKLRDLSATDFPNTGFTTPIMQLIVTSSDSKRTEKVLIAKNGNSYIAKRDGEAELYGLSPAAVSDLQQAAAGLKPLPTPQK